MTSTKLDAIRYRKLRALNLRNPLHADDYSGPVVVIAFPTVPVGLNGYVWEYPQGDALDAKLDALNVLPTQREGGST